MGNDVRGKSNDVQGKIFGELSKLIWILILVILAIAPFIPIVQGQIKSNYSSAFWILMVYYTLIFFGIGFFVSDHHILGILIDRRKMVSLSKLQMLLWTILVISGIVTIVVLRMVYNIENAFDIAIPATLWAMMGIATVSLVGSPLLKNDNLETVNKEVQKRLPKAIEDWKTNNSKTTVTEEDKAVIKAGIERKVEEELSQKFTSSTQTLKGSEIVNNLADDASIFDVFRGEEVGNYKMPDLGKIQMFIFTLIVWASYAMLIYQIIVKMNGIDQTTEFAKLLANCTNSNTTIAEGALNRIHQMTDFPDISEGMIGFLAISNAGYLAYKAVPREE